jgi:hypothetical protein
LIGVNPVTGMKVKSILPLCHSSNHGSLRNGDEGFRCALSMTLIFRVKDGFPGCGMSLALELAQLATPQTGDRT